MPPVHLYYIFDTGIVEPLLQAKAYEELSIRVVLLDLEDCGVREVVCGLLAAALVNFGEGRGCTVMAVTDRNNVHDGKVLDVAGYFCVSFWTHETEWATSFFENWVE